MLKKVYKKNVNKFIWAGKKGSINKEYLNAPIEKGGITLLDIQAQNKAIDLMWLKVYLLNNRPTWALIANVLIGECVAKCKNINKSLTANTFIQSWNPAMNRKHDLPMDL